MGSEDRCGGEPGPWNVLEAEGRRVIRGGGLHHVLGIQQPDTLDLAGAVVAWRGEAGVGASSVGD